MSELAEWMASSAQDLSEGGRWVVIAYSASPGDNNAVQLLLGSTRFLGRIVGDLRGKYPEVVFHLGRAVPDTLIAKVGALRSDCKLHILQHQDFDWTDEEHRKLLQRHLARHSPRFWSSRGIGLVDMSGFSTVPAPTQVALRLMLDMAFTAARTNLSKNLPTGHTVTFNRVSSGDGYYVWNRIPGPYADAITFAFLALVMAVVRGRERELPGLRLRGVYTVGEMYSFPYAGLWDPPEEGEALEDAVGPALNSASRLCSAAVPDQLLVGDFTIPGDPGQYRDPLSLLEFVRGLFPNEETPLDLVVEPPVRMRVVDKHGDAYHCFNVRGRGFYFTARTARKQEIGVAEDSSPPLTKHTFHRRVE